MRRFGLVLLGALLGAAGASAQVTIYPTPGPDLSGYVRTTDVPGAGTATPPPVNATGAVGSAAQYARADHTHVSSILKVVKTTAADGTVVWDYPPVNGVAFFTTAPVVQVTVETATGQPYLALITSNTAAQLRLKVLRAQTLPAVLSLVGALAGYDIFSGSVGAGVPVHIYAAKPTQ